jgi:hypothetical protein
MEHGQDIRTEAHKLVESLPASATWEDLARLVFERQMLEEGIADLDAGRSWTSDQIRAKLGLVR